MLTGNSFNLSRLYVFVKRIVLFLIMTSFLVTPLSIDTFAEEIYDINIPTGAASPDAPYFWQSEKDGNTSGNIDVIVGDTVVWKNADTATHTVTSGMVPEPDNLFDSGLFAPGKSFSYTFSEPGNVPYFCIVHPWMEGIVSVSAGYSIIPNVGLQIEDGNTSFDVEYAFNRVLSTAIIDEEQKSITFEIIGVSKSDDHTLEILLPVELIDGPFVMWVDDERIPDFELVQKENMNILFIPLNADAKYLTIIGTSIVPEFGPIVMLILVASIVPILFLSKRFHFN